MSFWESDLGEVTGKPEDAYAKSFTNIPDGTMALAKIESFINTEYEGNKYLAINWLLAEGDFKGAKVEQKLKVFGDMRASDPAKARHRALNMLKLIYQLFSIKPTHAGEPTDSDLALFNGKIAGIKIRETEPNEQGKKYNWVAEVHQAKGFKSETGPGLTHVATSSVASSSYHSSQAPLDSALTRNGQLPVKDLDDDIPF